MGVIFNDRVMLGPTVTPLRQAIQEEKLHGKFHFNRLFKVSKPCELCDMVFCIGEKTFASSCAVSPPPPPSRLITHALTGVTVTAEKATFVSEQKYRLQEGNRWKYAGEERVTKEDDVEGSINWTCVRGYSILLTSCNG